MQLDRSLLIPSLILLIRSEAYWFFITTGAHTEGLTFFLYSFLVCGQTDTLVLFRPERNLHMFKEEGTKCIEREHIQRCIIGIDRQWITNFVFLEAWIFSRFKVPNQILCDKLFLRQSYYNTFMKHDQSHL